VPGYYKFARKIENKLQKCNINFLKYRVRDNILIIFSARQLNLTDDKGVVVVGVKADSKAQNAGIQKGDLIKEVNRKPVEPTGEFKKLIHRQNTGDGLDLLVKRMHAGYAVIHLA
jgi:S1-C subfamily serine protease